MEYITTITVSHKKCIEACLVGNTREFSRLIKKTNSPHTLEKCTNIACEKEYIDIIKIILQIDDIDIRFNWNPPHSPPYNTRSLVMHQLFRHRKTDIIDMVMSKYNTLPSNHCLYAVCEYGDVDMFSKYLKYLPNTNSPYFLNECLERACMSYNPDMINYLVNKGANSWKSCLQNACLSGNIKTVSLIFSYWTNIYNDIGIFKSYPNYDIGFVMNEPNHDLINLWNSYMFNACRGGCIDIVKLMFEKGTKYGYDVTEQVTKDICLHRACSSGNIEVINLLISKGFNTWNTGLEGACSGGHLEIVKLMILNGADAFNDCMHTACIHGHLEIIKYMVQIGGVGDVYTHIHAACLYHHTDAVKILLTINASVHNCVYNGRIFSRVCLCHDLDLIKMMPINDPNIDWYKSLDNAIMSENIEIIQYILNCKEYFSETVLNNHLQHSVKNNNTDISNLLIKKGANNLLCLNKTNDFKLYRMYMNGVNAASKTNHKYWTLLQNYPPFVLLVGSRLTKVNDENKNCSVKKLPVELFVLLTQCV